MLAGGGREQGDSQGALCLGDGLVGLGDLAGALFAVGADGTG